MDMIQRAYAHSAWTAADPLKGLDAEQKRAILMMGSTFRERWKLRPWKDTYARQMAMKDIIAERRLAYELAYGKLSEYYEPAMEETPTSVPEEPQKSEYYKYRLEQHHEAMKALADERSATDQRDLESNPLARADQASRQERLAEFLAIELQQARKRVSTLEALAEDRPSRDPADTDVPPLAADIETSAKPNKRRGRGR